MVGIICEKGLQSENKFSDCRLLNSPCWHGVRLDPMPSFFNQFVQLLMY